MQVEDTVDDQRLVASFSLSAEGPVIKLTVSQKPDREFASVPFCFCSELKFASPNPDVVRSERPRNTIV